MECKGYGGSPYWHIQGIGIYPEWNVKAINLLRKFICEYHWNISRMECKEYKYRVS